MDHFYDLSLEDKIGRLQNLGFATLPAWGIDPTLAQLCYRCAADYLGEEWNDN